MKKASVKELAGLLQADGGVARLAAQQELLTRPAKQAASASWKIANDNKAPLYARTAAMYTYLQISGADAIPNITKLTSEPEMQEIALRALADRKGNFSKVSIAPFLIIIQIYNFIFNNLYSGWIKGQMNVSGKIFFTRKPLFPY